MKSVGYIVGLYEQRRSAPGEKWRNEALMLKAFFNGDLWAPVSERLGQEGEEYAVAANNGLMHLEQTVKRVVSTKPNVQFTSLKPGTKTSDDKARLRRMAALSMWDQNRVQMKDRKRVRSLLGYGNGPMQIAPHPTLPIPQWIIRDPLMTYAAPATEDTGFIPDNTIFAYKQTYAWLEHKYPFEAFMLHNELTSRKRNCNPDTMFEIIEYLDADERVMVLRHKDAAPSNRFAEPNTPSEILLELDRMTNRIGMCPMVVPTQITIDRLKSQYVSNIGMYIMRNKLAALEYLFAERTVFGDTYFVEPPNSPNGDIVELADGPSGKIGHLRGGSLETINMQPNFAGTQMIDRLEREERISNSTPAEWSGESASNIRTAVRGNAISSAAVDFTIQEAQEVLALAKESELRVAIAVDKEHYNRDKTFYVGFDGGSKQKLDYKPGDIWETDECHVFYSAAGTDINNQVIAGGQRIAQQTMSKKTFMMMDPMIEDPEFESDSIIAEQLEQSILTEFLQPGGVLDVVAKAEVAELVRSNKMDLSAAVAQIQRERQEKQASVDAEGNPTGVDPMSPEAQPGIGGPDAMAGIAGPNPDQMNLSSLLGNLRKPQMTGPAGA